MRISGWMLAACVAAPTALGAQTMPQNITAGQPPQISLQGQHFLETLASEDQSEIDLAKLALRKSNDPQVKEYARSKILAADPSMEQEAKNLGKQKHAVVTGFPSSTAKAEYYYLSKFSGKAFDKAYMNYEDAKQREDLIVVQNEAKGGKDPDVKGYAQKEVTPVREAADSAKNIAQALGGQQTR